MDRDKFYIQLPKIELHAHLNGSLSRSTMVQLQRCNADSEATDKLETFLDQFYLDVGDSKNLPDVFPLFATVQKLTTKPETIAMATALTLHEFEQDGCCYIELRSTPRETPEMSKREYIETIVRTMINFNSSSVMTSCFIISLNRSKPLDEAEIITNLAIEFHKIYPEIVVGIELSGDPSIGVFSKFIPALNRARKAGLKITLHCGELHNPEEIIEMLNFKPDRIGHAVCIHPKYGGTDETWKLLCDSHVPVEICITSNVFTKSVPDYSSHHFIEFFNANIPIILCTDDKGIFGTSLPNEYRICNETFNIGKCEIAKLSLKSCDHIFLKDIREVLRNKILNYINKNSLQEDENNCIKGMGEGGF